ncbi:MAG TPA: heme-binding beta-barrel domain-containing protein [Hyphomicrobiaceae bacterium]|nr:heme-binding beta-barrel domain-containing protein [Hyphomicrobiaceae bacterium]
MDANEAHDWGAWRFLLGDWRGEGGGAPGEGEGAFSFTAELQGQVIVRRNYAEYPATAERPAARHDDLMIVYRETPGADLRAMYFDSEGHVIHYTVEPSAHGRTVVFLSEIVPNAPRFRLTYTQTGDDTLALTFEVAPPGQPEAFTPYIQAHARRAPGEAS